jgi:hypothetical protein
LKLSAAANRVIASHARERSEFVQTARQGCPITMKQSFQIKVSCAALIVALAYAGTPAPGMAQTANTCADGAGVWLGSFGSGAVCVDGAGWKPATSAGKTLANDQVKDIEQCGDSVVVAHTLGLSRMQKGKWRNERLKAGLGGPVAIDCDSTGALWIAHHNGVSKFDGKKWTTTPSDKLGPGEHTSVLKDIVVGPKDTVWVATSSTIARFDGKDWTTWGAKDFGGDKQFFNRLALDSSGAPWVSAIGAVYAYDDGAWTAHKNTDIISNDGLYIDASDRVFVGSFGNGLFMLEDGDWTRYTRENGDLSSDTVRAIAVDSRKRVWVGTAYGLNVFDGKTWQTYDMSTSGMIDNDISVLEIEGPGPDLPKPAATKTGALSGIVTNGKTPAAGIELQVCVEFISSSFRGDSPCEGQPFSKTTKSDKDGKFTFDKLPAGYYGVVFKQANGKWARLVKPGGIGSERVLVPANGEAESLSLDLSKVKEG